MEIVTAYVRVTHKGLSLNGTTLYPVSNAGVDHFLGMIYDELGVNYPKFYKMDRLSQLGFISCEVLLKGVELAGYAPDEVAVVLANSNSSSDSDMRYLNASRLAPSPALFVYTLPNIVIGEICIRHKLKGENAFFVTSTFDGAFMQEYVALLMSSSKTKACIAGWVDVLDEQYDVLLYLVEKQPRGQRLEHTAHQLNLLFS
jgi:hypothetical protein